MAKRKVHFPLVHPHAAGIDIGSKSHFVCVGKAIEDVREFSVFTEDLHQMAKWLKENKVTTIAMESTGFYWKSLFLLLQDHGFEVILVNAVHTKNVRGKSQMSWIVNGFINCTVRGCCPRVFNLIPLQKNCELIAVTERVLLRGHLDISLKCKKPWLL